LVLIAEEVAEVDPGLVVRDRNVEMYSAGYDAGTALIARTFN
jgi:hypothetical protein